ncbi:MAG TPA: hypothetical protein VIC84_04885 [Blastocatellia bacterium]
MLSPSQYAEKVGRPYQTIMTWLRQGRIPAAEKTEVGKMVIYLIPEDATYNQPLMGRPKKSTKKAAKKAGK